MRRSAAPAPPSLTQLGWVVATFLLLQAAGCVHADLGNPQWKPPTTSFDAPEETEAGRAMAARLAAHPELSGLRLLRNGRDAFVARALMIQGAERAVDAQYYIFHDDLTGRFLFSQLLSAADRGVRVRLLLDDLGSPGLDPLLAAANAHPNMEVRLFNALARGPLPGLARGLDLVTRPRTLNHRMHNKMLAVDGLAAVIGGRNIGDEYFDAHEVVNFSDLDLLAFGPVLGELGLSFDLYWNSQFTAPIDAWARLRAGPDAVTRLRTELEANDAEARESPYAGRLASSPLVRQVQEGTIELLWASAHAVADLPEKIVARGEALQATLLSKQLQPYFRDAVTELVIVSPYFIPRDRGVEFLARATQNGVRVRVLTNSLAATDVRAVHAAYKGYRKAMLEAGVDLYELKHGGSFFEQEKRRGRFGSSNVSLHSKTFIFDRDQVFIGSLNLDPRSIDLNTEIGLVVDSPELAREQAERFDVGTGPEISWRVQLDANGDLVWEGSEAGVPQRLTSEPDTSWWTRFRVSLMGLLPIDGQL